MDTQLIDSVGQALSHLITVAIGAAGGIGIPALVKYFAGRLNNANKREEKKIEDTSEDQAVERDTRQLLNKNQIFLQQLYQRTEGDNIDLREVKHLQAIQIEEQALEIARLKPFEGEAIRGRATIEVLQLKLENCLSRHNDLTDLIDEDEH